MSVHAWTRTVVAYQINIKAKEGKKWVKKNNTDEIEEEMNKGNKAKDVNECNKE